MSNFTYDLPYEDYTTFPEYKAGILIWKVVPPILILLGTVGNSLSILVLTRKSIRSSTTALYLTVLAFSDLLVLYSGLLRQWIRFLFNEDVRHVSQFGCKLNIWLVYSSLDFSAWILIAVTLERVISAWLPHNAKTVCTRKSAAAFLISIGVFVLVLNSHLLYGMVFKTSYGITGEVELRKCVEIDDDYAVFFNKTWPWIDLCAFCAIPFTVIVIGNCLILFKVIKSQRKTKSRIVPTIQNGTTPISSSSGHSGSKQSSMTAMLFTLNVVFLVTTSPVSIYNIGYTNWIKGADLQKFAELDLWWAIVNMFMYTNNSLNFLLYCLSGTRFRREVVRIFTIRKRENSSEQVRLGQSNYTRTRFDTPSVSPTPRHSASPYTARAQTPNTGSSMDIHTISFNGVNGNVVESKNNVHKAVNGKTDRKISGNSLHPSDALKISKPSAINSTPVSEIKTDEMNIESTDSTI